MQFFKIIVLSVFAVMLVACSKSPSDSDYNSVAASSNVVVPAAANTVSQTQYYKIPGNASKNGVAAPSMLPPQIGSTSKSNGQVANNKRDTLILNSKVAVTQLSNALASNKDFKLIDKDIKSKMFYVLYTKQTKGSIKSKTPAYIVYLQPVKSGYLVTVMDSKKVKLPVDLYNQVISSIKGSLS